MRRRRVAEAAGPSRASDGPGEMFGATRCTHLPANARIASPQTRRLRQGATARRQSGSAETRSGSSASSSGFSLVESSRVREGFPRRDSRDHFIGIPTNQFARSLRRQLAYEARSTVRSADGSKTSVSCAANSVLQKAYAASDGRSIGNVANHAFFRRVLVRVVRATRPYLPERGVGRRESVTGVELRQPCGQ